MSISPLRALSLVLICCPLIALGVNVSVSTTTAGCGSASGTATATVSGGIPPYAYVWSPTPPFGQGTPQITGLMQGVYTVEVTDGLGNTAQASGMVEQYSALNYPYFWTDRNDCMNSCSGIITIDENTLGGSRYLLLHEPCAAIFR
ncbi:MAG TPA: SprB repeat-containing protein [Flavobacteriales bacterium]|nr:SprB repeat-containing protein [Flavobacteriales bacterium]